MPVPVLASSSDLDYRAELTRAMTFLGAKRDTLFMGQSVGAPGTAMFGTLSGVPVNKRLELPVFENSQLGMSIGMALRGCVPISIFPRFPFLLEATGQLVNHLDKLPLYSHGGYRPKVIVRTAVPSPVPLDPQAQHLGDYSDAFRLMLKTVEVIELARAEEIFPAYKRAYERTDGRSTLLVEHTAAYA